MMLRTVSLVLAAPLVVDAVYKFPKKVIKDTLVWVEKDVETTFKKCTEFDDKAGLEIFDRMQQQRPYMAQVLPECTQSMKMAARVVYYAYTKVRNVNLDAYFVDLAQDLWYQISEYADAQAEWYYWHGPKRQMPATLKMLINYFNRSISSVGDTIEFEKPSEDAGVGVDLADFIRGENFAKKPAHPNAGKIPVEAFDLADFEADKSADKITEFVEKKKAKHVIVTPDNMEKLPELDGVFKTIELGGKTSSKPASLEKMPKMNLVIFPKGWLVSKNVEALGNQLKAGGETKTLYGVVLAGCPSVSFVKSLGDARKKIAGIAGEWVQKALSVLHVRNDIASPCPIAAYVASEGWTLMSNPKIHSRPQEYRIAKQQDLPCVIKANAMPTKGETYEADIQGNMLTEILLYWRVLPGGRLDYSEFKKGGNAKEMSELREKDKEFPRTFKFPWEKVYDMEVFPNTGKAWEGFDNPDRKWTEPKQKGWRPSIKKEHIDNLDQLAVDFRKNEDLVIVENFFDDDSFEKIKAEGDNLWGIEGMEPNCNLDGRDRIGGYILDDRDKPKSFYEYMYSNPALQYWVSYIYGKRMWSSDFPVELREYGDSSNGMQCHRDLQLFAEEHVDAEFAYTIANSSPNHQVSFYDKEGKQHFIKPKANTLLMVRPNASLHCAHKVDPGSSRQMMKWIYTGSYKKQARFEMYAENSCGKSSLSWKSLEKKKADVLKAKKTVMEEL